MYQHGGSGSWAGLGAEFTGASTMVSENNKSLLAGGGIDKSAWTAGLSYFVAWMVAAAAHPNAKYLTKRPELIVMAAGLAFFFFAVMVIQRHMQLSLRATDFGEPQQLVKSWVFAYSRNPIYVAFLVPLATLAVLSIIGAVVGIALYVAIMNRYVIPGEERDLERLFGQDYRDYKVATPRWIM